MKAASLGAYYFYETQYVHCSAAAQRDDHPWRGPFRHRRHPATSQTNAPGRNGGAAPAPAALVSATQAREAGLAHRVFWEGEVDLPARPLVPVRPRHPEQVRRMARESDVMLAVTVEADGAVSSVEFAQSGGEEFDREAREAVERARFEPGVERALRLPPSFTFAVRFRLDD